MKTQRRSVLKKIFASIAGIAGAGAVAKAAGNPSTEKEAGILYMTRKFHYFPDIQNMAALYT